MSKRDQVLDKATDRLRELTINELFDENANATGTLANSIKYIGKETETGVINIALEMEDYGFILDEGRGGAKTAGSQPWQPKIVQWIRAKGIRPKPGVTIEQLSYAIYNSINKKGYKAKPFVDQATGAFAAAFAGEFAEATAEDIEIDLKKIKGIK